MRTADGSVTKVVTSDAVFAAGAGAFRRDRACIATMAAAAVYLAAQLVLALAGWQNRWICWLLQAALALETFGSVRPSAPRSHPHLGPDPALRCQPHFASGC